MQRLPISVTAGALALLLAGALPSAYAQAPVAPPSPEARPVVARDSLDRQTPRGAVAGFMDAIAQQDFARAAQYLDLSALPAKDRTSEGRTLAANLATLLDKGGSMLPGTTISDDPLAKAASPEDVEPVQVGSFTLDDDLVPVLLERQPVPHVENGWIWLISEDTVAHLPRTLEAQSEAPVDSVMPSFLARTKLRGLPLGHYLALLLLFPVAFAIAWAVVYAVSSVAGLLLRGLRMNRTAAVLQALAMPLTISVAALLFVDLSQRWGISVHIRQRFVIVPAIAFLASLLLLFWRLVDSLSLAVENRLAAAGDQGRRSILLFLRRLLKAGLIAFSVLALLRMAGVNITAGLAALGVGGLALALGAQKAVENLVGTVMLTFDQPLRVGDFCKAGDTMGTVEQIGIRSTRIRTLDRVIVTIPNGDLSARTIANYTVRDRFLMNARLGLRYETSPDQMRYLLVELRKVLLAHPRIVPESARVRFVEFGSDSLVLEVFAYFEAATYPEYLEIQEEVFLAMSDVVTAGGAGFAFPSQTLYLARDARPDDEKRRAAEAKAREWRQDKADEART